VSSELIPPEENNVMQSLAAALTSGAKNLHATLNDVDARYKRVCGQLDRAGEASDIPSVRLEASMRAFGIAKEALQAQCIATKIVLDCVKASQEIMKAERDGGSTAETEKKQKMIEQKLEKLSYMQGD